MEKVKAGQSDASKEMTNRDNEMFNQYTKPSVVGRATNGPNISSGADSARLANSKGKQDAPAVIDDVPKLDIKPVVQDVTQSSSASSSPSTSPRLPPTPSTSYQFQGDWKVVRHHPELFYQYFKVNFCMPLTAYTTEQHL